MGFKILESNPYATRENQLRKLVNNIEWDTVHEGLELAEVRHRMYFSIWFTARKLGLELRNSDQGVWYIRAYNEDSGSIEWQRLTLKRVKPFIMEVAYQKGLIEYITTNQFIIDILKMVFNRQRILVH